MGISWILLIRAVSITMKFLALASSLLAAVSGQYLGYAGYPYAAHAIVGLKSAPCVNAANVPVPCAAGYYGKREAEADPQYLPTELSPPSPSDPALVLTQSPRDSMPSPKESLSPTPESTDTESTASVMPRLIPRSWPMEPPSPTPWPLLPTAVWSTLPWSACAPTTSVPRSHAN